MIEIEAKLARLPVYFANESVNSTISFTNKSTNKTRCEQLAWCVVQIHCHLTVDENRVAATDKNKNKLILEEHLSVTSQETSFHPCKGERGLVVFSTKPKFLFCDLKLEPCEKKIFHYNDILPNCLPPSYAGSAIKYFYKMTVGVQRVNSPIQLLRMPLKVLNIFYENNNKVSNQDDSKNEQNNSSLNNSKNNYYNFFDKCKIDDCDVLEHNSIDELNDQSKNVDILNVLLHKLDCISSKRTLNSYVITNNLGRVAKFCILKTVFKLGEDIIGFFDFSESEIPCVQFTVTLQSEEKLKEEYRIKNKNYCQTTSYNKCSEFCLQSYNTQVILPIPLTITPSFQTNIVSLIWKLHFEFVTTKSEDINNLVIYDNFGKQLQSPKNVNVQIMVWDLPIVILPTHPVQVGRVLQLPDTCTISI